MLPVPGTPSADEKQWYTNTFNGTSSASPIVAGAATVAGAVLTDNFAPVSARYVRLTVIGASGYTGTWTSILEWRTFGW